jgi:hypothetical protein
MPDDQDFEQLRDLVIRHGLVAVLHGLAAISEDVSEDATAYRPTAPLHLRTCAELVVPWSC